MTPVLRSAAAVVVALPLYFFALLLFTVMRHFPVQGKVLGVGVAFIGGYLAGRISGRERSPVVHAAIPCLIFLWPLNLVATVVLTAVALLGGYVTTKRLFGEKAGVTE